MTKASISPYFNPDQHLVFHQDKEGNMIGGGYHIDNLLFKQKVPLFVSLDDGIMHGQSGGANGDETHKHFIPEKFSDLFRDLAVPAGLFMMPALHRPRNYAFEVPEIDAEDDMISDKSLIDPLANPDIMDDNESSSDSDDEYNKRKQVPKDIFDALLSLVTPTERIQHDVKTRRHRKGDGSHVTNKKMNSTKRVRTRIE